MKRIKARHLSFYFYFLSIYFVLILSIIKRPKPQFFVYFIALVLLVLLYKQSFNNIIIYKIQMFKFSSWLVTAQVLHPNFVSVGWLKVILFSQARKTSKPQEASDTQSPQTQNYQLSDLGRTMSPLPCFLSTFR